MKLQNWRATGKYGFMQRLRFVLPPPSLLITFEAAGRCLSFTQAADELSVSRVAVSQQIKALESFIGAPLFYRKQRSVALTHVGSRYHKAVSAALAQVLDATIDISKKAESNVVSISATPGFTTYWLLPNITTFQTLHPKIELRFIVSDTALNLAQENIDLGIRYGEPPFLDLDSTLLVREEISPTCTASYLNACGLREIEAADLVRHPLIELDGPYEEQTRWSSWFRTQGIHVGKLPGGITVNTYTNLVQATLDGQGFALLGPPLIDRFLANGTLVQPVLSPKVVRHAFHLVTPRHGIRSPAAGAFIDWITRCFKVSDRVDL
ncbi:LysR substrate-binding domain-containing protein [Bradyrhizobium sp. RDI18]|uniref:LysR substrate-binding domain-containing protein n=1 Tax=Bradyrhizobium sp. RDI18 TaxID=3367400 RepID=UPI0037191315